MPVSNEVLLEKIENLHGKTDEVIKRVTETNGRVKSLELWKAYLIGAWGVLSLLITISVPFVLYSLNQNNKEIESLIEQKINQNNEKQFETYNK